MSSPAQVASEPTPQSAYLAQVVVTIIEFALRCGLPPQQLQALVTEQLARGSGSAVSQTAVGNSLYVVTPNVLLRWHSDLSLLDAEGNPKPLRLHGADFLTSVDNWLTQRSSQRAGRKATPVLGVGVHVFAHIQPEAKKPARARLARR